MNTMLSRNFKNPIFIISILIFALTTLVLSDIAFARIRLAKVAMQVSTGVVSNFSGTSFDFFPALVKTYADNKNLYVESHGFPDHRLMVGITNWQQQVPIPQDYTGKNAWQIPLKPVISTSPISLKTSLYRGAVALAANGVPVFNALNNRGENSHDVGELDEFGGHSGKGSDYHYHTSPLLLEKIVGIGRPVAYGLDGFPMYASTEPDGIAMSGSLDECHGHYYRGAYHYHATSTYPYSIGCMRGVVTVVDEQISPQPMARTSQPVGNPLPGATITDFVIVGENSYSLEYTLTGQKKYINYKKNSTGEYIFENSDTPSLKSLVSTRSGSVVLSRTTHKITPVSSPIFQLTSTALSGGLLPAEYTCDGVGSTPPLSWTGVPKGTQSFVLIMHHMPKDGEAHWYWQLYDIPATISSLAKNTKNIGIVGTNSKNKDLAYTPPCSQGPGAKTYTLTLYALSVEPKILVSKDAITRDTLLTAMKNITLASSSLDIVYSR